MKSRMLLAVLAAGCLGLSGCGMFEDEASMTTETKTPPMPEKSVVVPAPQPIATAAPRTSPEAPRPSPSSFSSTPAPAPIPAPTPMANRAPTPVVMAAPVPPTGHVAPNVSTGGKTYKVQKGDTLWGIAVKVYGDSKKYKQIAQANKITDPNKVVAGQVLTLP